MPTPPKRPPKGRKPIPLDLGIVESSAGVGCSVEEIAAELRVSARTIQRRKEKAFLAALERGRARGSAARRRAQWKAAIEGNVTAQIWWGKQFLGQRSFEQREVTGKEEGPIAIQKDITAALSEHLNALRAWRRRAGAEAGALVPGDHSDAADGQLASGWVK